MRRVERMGCHPVCTAMSLVEQLRYMCVYILAGIAESTFYETLYNAERDMLAKLYARDVLIRAFCQAFDFTRYKNA